MEEFQWNIPLRKMFIQSSLFRRLTERKFIISNPSSLNTDMILLCIYKTHQHCVWLELFQMKSVLHLYLFVWQMLLFKATNKALLPQQAVTWEVMKYKVPKLEIQETIEMKIWLSGRFVINSHLCFYIQMKTKP